MKICTRPISVKDTLQRVMLSWLIAEQRYQEHQRYQAAKLERWRHEAPVHPISSAPELHRREENLKFLVWVGSVSVMTFIAWVVICFIKHEVVLWSLLLLLVCLLGILVRYVYVIKVMLANHRLVALYARAVIDSEWLAYAEQRDDWVECGIKKWSLDKEWIVRGLILEDALWEPEIPLRRKKE